MQHKVYTGLVKAKGDRGLGGTLWNRPVSFPAPLLPPRVPTPPCESVPFKYYLPVLVENWKVWSLGMRAGSLT